MLQTSCIGHLGADAECKNANGKDFVSFRIANTDKWTDDAGQVHENTTWIDVIIPGRPKVFEYLKKGQLVYVTGSISLRVYSSPKDKCMKAGLTINAVRIELLGGRSDDVPSILYTEDGAKEIHVGKFFYAPESRSMDGAPTSKILVSKSGERFIADPEGWVKKEQVSAS